MVQNLLASGPRERGLRQRGLKSPVDEGFEDVRAKVATLLAKIDSERCAEPGCPEPVSLVRPPKVSLRGYCNIHRQIRALALSANIEPDRARAAKLLSEKCSSVCIDVTPALALAMLEWNRNNRRINPDRIEVYAKDMISGDWCPNNQGIGIGADKLLVDGQHRLWAVVKSGCTVRMLVVTGLSPDAFPTIDQGRSRSVGDALQIFDGQPHGKRIVSWLKAIDTLHGGRRTPISHAVARRELGRFEDSVRWFSSCSARAPFGRAPVLGALVYAHAVEPDHVETFTRRYLSGANLEEESPVLALRNYVADRLLGRSDSSRAISLKTLKCVLADQRGEPMARVVASEDAFGHFHQLHVNAATPEEGERMQARVANSTSRAGERGAHAPGA